MTSSATIPMWVDRASDLSGSTALFAFIAGRSLRGAVMAKDGLVKISLDPEDSMGGRAVSFNLYHAPSGSNGTLLFSLNAMETPKVLGVFRGLNQLPSSSNHELQGVAVAIPPYNKMSWLKVSKYRITKVALSFTPLHRVDSIRRKLQMWIVLAKEK